MRVKHVVKKLSTLIITLLVISFLVFLAFETISGDPATSMLGTQATKEKVEALKEELGLNRPLLIRYIEFIKGALRGDFGISYSYKIPVSELLKEKISVTAILTLLSFFIILLISVPLSVLAAKKEGGFFDRLIVSINQIIMAIPPFFMGILLTVLFGLILKWFTPGGYISYKQDVGAFLRYLILPAIAIALPKAAMTMKLFRSSILNQLKLDYIRTAYSKGNKKNRVLYKHALKNAWIPVITFLGMTAADLVAGSLIIEQVFSIPGVGRMLFTSISNRDYPVVQAIIILLAVIVMVINFVVDLLYQWLDPRIRIQT